MAQEGPIQKAIIDYLTLRRYFFWRNNSGAMKTEHGSFVRFGSPGSPDIFLLKNALLWGIEVKSPIGKLSDMQRAFRDAMTEAGGTYIVARSLDDVMAAGL